MRLRQELSFMIRRLIHRSGAERELDEEIRVYLEMEIERNMADGMSPEDARMAARRSFGSVAFAEADQLVTIWETHPEIRGPVGTYQDFLDWRAEAQSFHGLSAFSNKRYRKAEVTGRSETIEAQGMLISTDLFSLLGLKPILGRNFLPEEEQPVNNRVVILSEYLWSRGFANDQGIIGKSIQLAGGLRPTVLLVFAAVALVLLIACANISNLLLAQSTERQREMAIRAAIGAGRGRLVRQLLVESALLTLLGGVAGLALAALSIPVLRSGMLGIVTGKIPGLDMIGIDWLTLAFSFGVSLLTGILVGSLPALQISRVDLNQTLKDGGRGAAGAGRRNLSDALVTAEVALAVIVLVGAGLLVRSFQKLSQVDPGFRADHLLSLKIELSQSRYQSDEGIRLTLGAKASDVLKLVIGRGMAPVLPGLAFGLAGAFALSRSLTSLTAGLLFEVRATDPPTFMAIALLLMVVALLACYIPARQATKVDPLAALRHD